MQRPNLRQASPGGGGLNPGGFCSPTGMFPSPPGAFRGPPPSFGGPRFGFSGSPNTTPPRDFSGTGNGNRSYHSGGKQGRFYNGSSPGYTPRRPQNAHFRGGSSPYPNSPYQANPGQQQGYQGSPRTSTPFGSSRGGRGSGGGVEKYYAPSMLQDPWASLQPVAVTDSNSKCSTQQATHTGRPGRYFN